jgi:hypothetical protein
MNEKNAQIDAAIKELGLGLTAVFIPWSQSRHFKKDAKLGDYNLNWKVTIYKDGKSFLETTYTAGIGHCKNKPAKQGAPTIYEANLIIAECEGKAICEAGITRTAPKPRDVIYSIVADSDVLEYGCFEDWAQTYGYDTDSRNAEAIYRACLEHGLKIRLALGEEGLTKIRVAYQDY